MWIRSQGKETLILLNGFEYRQQRERHCIFGISTYGDDIHIASYNTKERCIEVLDEIHAYINGEYGTKLAIKSIHESQMKEEIDEKLALELMDKLEFVYVMPEQ